MSTNRRKEDDGPAELTIDQSLLITLWLHTDTCTSHFARPTSNRVPTCIFLASAYIAMHRTTSVAMRSGAKSVLGYARSAAPAIDVIGSCSSWPCSHFALHRSVGNVLHARRNGHLPFTTSSTAVGFICWVVVLIVCSEQRLTIYRTQPSKDVAS